SMGPARAQAKNHSRSRTRTRDPGAQRNRGQPGPCCQTSGHYPSHLAQTCRKVWDPARVEHQVTEPSLLLLIPAYNEEARIEPVLRDYAQYFQDHYDGRFSLVVVLNGCRDNTLAVVQRVARDFSCIRAENFVDPIGKGGALIEGLKLAPTADVVG